MIVYLGAVVVASLVGSAHCVGMCGPMTLIATGMRANASNGWERGLRMNGYHAGRLSTYLIFGLVVGLLGSIFDRAAEVWGWIGTASWSAGVLMIAVGLGQLWRLRKGIAVSNEHDFVTRWLLHRIAAFRRQSDRLPGPLRAFAWGFVTTWLPCGWLYTFALVAAGAGSVFGSLAVMTAFWIGTLPALSSLTWLWSKLTPRFQSAVPVIASLLLIVFGGHVVLARSGSTMGDWLQSQHQKFVSTPSIEILNKSVEEPPPCCRR